MPEGVEVDTPASPKASEQKAEAAQSVRWEVEDPSEFRPEMLSDMGKAEAEFRIFNVSEFVGRYIS